ncbi:terminase large subunit domain-containing protein [Acidovorax sp. A1169]|uniref:terminase large subunit domain-containing protein n=1 Tax=Acidovorax sp. A1169 TaxID=3059524 RepID=UPI002737AD91|nr:terminase family protein [Acidovorax sp. A1169]MDP4076234.1 terminase family protein [Acidovorax sp. A1169]
MLPDALENATLEQIEAMEVLLLRRLAGWRMRNFFKDDGPLRRELYGRHMAFFRAGATHRERCFMAGNRVGKTIGGAYETTLHLTGRYPDWWQGRRFDKPIHAWAAGKTTETTRDIVQLELYGQPGQPGTGMIPADDIVKARPRPNGNGALDFIRVKHLTGGESVLGFKSYDQGRKAFEGTAKHWVWLDEEPPPTVYNECLTRTATTQGLIAITFTPLEGATEVVLDFLTKGQQVTT